MSSKVIIRLSAGFAFVFWLLYIVSELFISFSNSTGINSGIHNIFPKLMLNLYLASLYLYFHHKVKTLESHKFTDALWNVFVIGLITTLGSIVMRVFILTLGSSALAKHFILTQTIYIINIGLGSILLLAVFAVWKRLILYQKSKFLLKIWTTFEYTLVLSLLYNILPIQLPDGLSLYYIVLLLLMGLFLSVYMRWVAYLDFRQKWKSILLILLVILYIAYFTNTLLNAGDYNHTSVSSISWSNVFMLALITFTFLYALFSLLVILFNLPTSSVFEQKLEEVVNFQRLSQSIQTDQNEGQVYQILLDSAVSAVSADAAWVEVLEENETSSYYQHQISTSEISQIKNYVKKNKLKGVLDKSTDKSLRIDKHLAKLKGLNFKSIKSFEINVQGRKIGILALLKEVRDGFDKNTTNILKTYVSQAEVSVENFRLLNEAIKNERYKEELKIAQKVQSSLLPKNLVCNNDFDIAAFSIAADEVGGDYYDTFRINEHKIALIIGDVSGKGTSAAFYMSQMKGVFHSLAQMNFSTKDFLTYANTAISHCLEKTSFITATIFIIDHNNKTIEYARAGHCPTLYYSDQDKTANFFDNKGLGLGIVRNNDFEKYIQVNRQQYKSGDIMVLYTDGITEAKDQKGSEYGYDRLKEVITNNNVDSPEIIQKKLIKDLYLFTGTELIDDDYTTIIVKFKNEQEH